MLLACLALLATACGGQPVPRHLVFVLAEDQGAHLGALGTAGLETPRLDALARAGALLTRVISPYPVCSAARASIYTGRWPAGHGLKGNTLNLFQPAAEVTEADRAHPLYTRSRIDEAVPTLVEMLSERGFRTAVTHKLHVLPVEKFPYDLRRQRTDADDIRSLVGELNADGEPFFLMLNLKGSHRPFVDSTQQSIGVDPSDVRLPMHLPDTPVVRRDWAEYLDSIERTDALVGVLVDALAGAGVLDETLIVFTSDHGPAFQRGKMSLHGLGVHVPAIVSGPGVTPGVSSDALSSHVDWLPTLLDLLDVPAPAPLDGVSLAPLLRGDGAAPEREFAFAEIDHEVHHRDDGMRERSVQDRRYRLIWRDDGRKPRTMNADLWRRERWRNRTYDETIAVRATHPASFEILGQVDTRRLRGRAPDLELYDLETDPDEMLNRARDASLARERARLLAALHAHAERMGDPAATRMGTRR